MVFCGNNSELQPVLPSRKHVEDQDGNGRYIPVNLLNELSWASSHWPHVKLRNITVRVRQSSDRAFRDLSTL